MPANHAKCVAFTPTSPAVGSRADAQSRTEDLIVSCVASTGDGEDRDGPLSVSKDVDAMRAAAGAISRPSPLRARACRWSQRCGDTGGATRRRCASLNGRTCHFGRDHRLAISSEDDERDTNAISSSQRLTQVDGALGTRYRELVGRVLRIGGPVRRYERQGERPDEDEHWRERSCGQYLDLAIHAVPIEPPSKTRLTSACGTWPSCC